MAKQLSRRFCSRKDVDREMQSIKEAAVNYGRARQKTTKVLRDMVAYLTKHHANAQAAKVVGTAAGLLGTGLAIGCFAGSCFTYVASLVISAVGACVGVVGGLITVGGMATEAITSRIMEKRVRNALEYDDTAHQKFIKATGRVRLTRENMCAIIGLRTAALGGQIVGVLEALMGVGYQMGEGMAVAGVIFSVVAILMDMYTLITSLKNIAKKRAPELVNEMNTFLKELECPSEDEMRERVSKLIRLPTCPFVGADCSDRFCW